jgi:transposase
MDRPDLERLSKAELIELVLRLQLPPKTSRTSSKPPSTDRKERREKSRQGGAKPGHEGHSRALSEDFDRAVDHYPDDCPGCGAVLSMDLPAQTVSEHDKIDLPIIAPFVERHRRLAVSLSVLRPAGCRPPARGGEGHAVRTPRSCGGDVPQNLPGSFLRTP